MQLGLLNSISKIITCSLPICLPSHMPSLVQAQCFEFGELSHALGESLISETDPRVIELGEILSTHVGLQRGGEDDTRFTLVDSTGIGASDLAIAEAVYSQLGEGSAPPTAPQHRWRHPLTVGQSRL